VVVNRVCQGNEHFDRRVRWSWEFIPFLVVLPVVHLMLRRRVLDGALGVSLVWGVLVVRIRRGVGVVLAVTSLAAGLAFAPAAAAPPAPEIPSPESTIDGKVVQEGPTSEPVPTELPEGWVPREVPPLVSGGAEELSPMVVDRAIQPSKGVSPEPAPEPFDAAKRIRDEQAKVDQAVGVKGFDPVLSRENVAERSEFASVFENPDGTSTAKVTLEPQHYRNGRGSWAKIDPRLVPVPGQDGVWETAAGSIRVRANETGVTVVTPKGRTFGFGFPETLKPSVPVVSEDGLTVTYVDVQPGVDLRFRVSAAAVTKEFVLNGPGTGSSFELVVDGLEIVSDGEGGVRAVGAAADDVTIGRVTVFGADGAPVADPNVGAVVAAEKTGAGSRLAVSVDPEWLRSLRADQFPIVIDPTLWLSPLAGFARAWARNSSNVDAGSCGPTCSAVHSGNASDDGLYRWRSVFAFDYVSYLPTATMPSKLIDATFVATPQPTPPPFNSESWVYVRRASDYGWCGLFTNFANCSGDNPSWERQLVTNNTQSVALDVTDILGGYWGVGQSNVGWMFNGDEASGGYTFKLLTDPALLLTFDRTPVVTSRTPGDGTRSARAIDGLRMEVAAAADPDPGETTHYRYWLCRTPGLSDCLTNYVSGWTSSPVYMPFGPAGVGSIPIGLYGKDLYWMVETTGSANPGSAANIQSSSWYSWKWQNLLPTSLPTLLDPIDGFEWSPPATVVLRAGPPPTDPDGDVLRYRFVVREKGAQGIATRSTWYEPAMCPGSSTDRCWTIPANAPLTPGLVYEWTVELGDWSSISLAQESSGMPAARSARFEQRLGSSGPSPFQTVGPVSVNLANGNVSTSVATVGFSTATGQIGSVLEYNSIITGKGLSGRYVDSTNKTVIRVDPTINFSWGLAAPMPALGDVFDVTWTGYITVPSTGTYYFGAGADDRVKVTVATTVVLDQTICCVDGAFPATSLYHQGTTVNDGDGNPVGTAQSVALTEGTPVPIQIDYRDNGGEAHVELYAGTAKDVLTVVPSDWLTPASPVLPAGWTLASGAGSGASYTSARVEAGQIVLSQFGGDSIAFQRTIDGGYTPPPGVTDHVTLNGDGTVRVSAADGSLTTFTLAGQLERYVTSAEAGAVTTTYTYAGYGGYGEQRLLLQTDAVSGRTLTYNYYGIGSIGTVNYSADCLPAGVDPALVAGMLCSIRRPDGQKTTITYVEIDKVARVSSVSNPGNVKTQFGWFGQRMISVRPPYLADLMSAGKVLPGSDSYWALGYNTNGTIVSVTAPKATSAATTNEGVTFNWSATTAETWVKVNNLDTLHPPAAAWDRRVKFDDQARWVEDWTARGVTSFGSNTNSLERTAVWHTDMDLLLEQRDHGRITSYVYDRHNWLTDTYGPASASCFDTNTELPISAPFRGHLPNVTGLNVCTPTVARTHTDYDTTLTAGGGQTPMLGLGATNWSNRHLSGAPSSLNTVAATGGLDLYWGTGQPPGVSVFDFWSSQFAGEITFPAAGTPYTIRVTSDDVAKVYIDDVLIVSAVCCSSVSGIYTVPAGSSLTRRIRIDYIEQTGDAYMKVEWSGAGIAGPVTVPSSALAPAYGLATRTTVDDSSGAPATVTHTRYDQGWDPAYGLATATIVDPAGAALTTLTFYDTLRRRSGRTLPGGNDTFYSYYANTGTSPAVACPDGTTIAGGVNQGGQLTESSSAAITTSFVYDILGRPVATRVGSEAWTCMQYDARGRVIKTAYPGNSTHSARTVYSYFWDTWQPDKTYTVDSAGSIITTSDFLGRQIEYIDTTGSVNKTTTTYDAAGRVVRRYGTTIGASATSPGLQYLYDRGGFVTQVLLDGQPVAVPTYSSGVIGGELAQVTYPSGFGNGGNGTTVAYTRNPSGATTGMTWTGPGGTAITSDTVTRSQSGRIINQSIDGVDPYLAGDNYAYDPAGRLTGARAQNGSYYQYAYAANSPTCGSNQAAGLNANRTSASVNGTTVATFCYNWADRLTSVTSSTAPYNGYTGTISYDAHGNTTALAGEQLAYDQANRHMATYTPNTASPTAAVIYQRDLSDQITSRTAYTTTAGGVTQLLAPNEQSFAPGATDWTGGTVTAGTYVGANSSGAQLVNTSPATAGHVYTARVQLANSTFDFNELALQFFNSANLLLDARYAIMTDQTAGTYTVTYTAPANTTRVAMQINGANYESNPATITIANASLIRHNPATTTVETHRYSQGATLDTTGTVIERTIALPGGATLTKRAGGDVWSHPNIHGDIQAITNASGVKQGATLTYDPYGTPLAGYADNQAGSIDYTWLGQHHKANEHLTGLKPTIQMGARPYNPTLGRFLEVDPIEGGNANDYTYPEDPINHFDLDGQCGTFGNPFKKCKDKNRKDKGFLGGFFTKSRVSGGGCALIVCGSISIQGGRISVDSSFGAAYAVPSVNASWEGTDNRTNDCYSNRDVSAFIQTPVVTFSRSGGPGSSPITKGEWSKKWGGGTVGSGNAYGLGAGVIAASAGCSWRPW
jgi:RHS repeat-associated protein